ncbi:hypothetical protein PWT90_02717 [Aphanocladium album]|nr:hypothetical protein PWT90_02717 [Aphanocladium album]
MNIAIAMRPNNEMSNLPNREGLHWHGSITPLSHSGQIISKQPPLQEYEQFSENNEADVYRFPSEDEQVALVNGPYAAALVRGSKSNGANPATGSGRRKSQRHVAIQPSNAQSHQISKQSKKNQTMISQECLQRYVESTHAEERERTEQRLFSERQYIEERLAEQQEGIDREINRLRQKLSKREEKHKSAADKTTDDDIQRKWETLGFNIRSVVLTLRCYEPDDDEKTLATLRTRVPSASFDNVTAVLRKEIFETYLEAFLWKFVYTEVFSGHGHQWRSTAVSLVQEAKRAITKQGSDPSKRTELALWFAQGCEATTSQLDTACQQPMADELAETLFSMIHPDPQARYQREVKDILGVVIHDATELALGFMSSKALLIPDWPMEEQSNRVWTHEEFVMDNSTEDGSKERFVVIKPSLEKYGNADGEKHDLSRVLCHPVVLYF